MKQRIRIVFVVILVLQSGTLFSQEKLRIIAGVDVVSRYIWRGSNIGLGFDGSNSFHIQPSLVGTYKNFEIGYWGSFGATNGYSEYDLWAKYKFKQFSISVFDYNSPFEDENGNTHGGYFNIPFSSLGSYAEVNLAYAGGENFPIYVSYNRFFYNDDATYLEAGYKFNTKKQLPMDFNVGMTPAAGSYAEKAGFVNVSLKVSYDIHFTEKFRLPIFTSLIRNPQLEKTFFVVGLSLSTN